MNAILTSIEGAGLIVIRPAAVEPHASEAARRAYRGAYQVDPGTEPVDVSGLATARAIGEQEIDGVTVVVGSWGMQDTATVRLLGAGEREAILDELARPPAEEAEEEMEPTGRIITGAEADIEANYPGGYRAFLRDEARADRLRVAESE